MESLTISVALLKLFEESALWKQIFLSIIDS